MPTGPGPAPRRCAREATGPSVAASGADPGRGIRIGRRSGLVGLLLRDQAADPLGEQGAVERLLECVVEPQAVRLVPRLVAGERDQDGGDVVGALAEVLGDLPGLDAADGQVDDDAIRVEGLGPDARLEAA